LRVFFFFFLKDSRACFLFIDDNNSKVRGDGEGEGWHQKTTKNLELESVGGLTLGEGELGRQVLAEVLDLVDSLKDNLVGGLLESDLVLGKGLLLLLTLEESLLSGGLLGGLGAGKVGIVQLSIDLGGIKLDLGGGGNDVGLVDTLEGDTVDLEGAGDEQQARLELLQEDNTLAAVATGQEDKDGTGNDGAAELGNTGVLAVLLGESNILSGVEAGGLGSGNDAGTTVLGALDLNGLVGGSGGGGNGTSGLALVQDTLGNDLRAAVLVDTRGQERVAGLVNHF